MSWKTKFEAAANPALQFSGGKDSLACLYLLRPYWSRLTVIWANQGDPFPETLELVEAVKPLVKEFHQVNGQSFQDAETAFPVDLVPVRSTWLGMQLEPDGQQIRLRSRYDCCWANFWLPMTQAVKALGIDLLVRGQRRSEELRAPVKEGSLDPSGAEVVLPIDDWSVEDVYAYLKEQGVPLPRFYELMGCSIDCMHCTAYLKDSRGKVAYLRKYHPSAAVEYERRLGLVGQALLPDINEMKDSLIEITREKYL